ncbi:MAG: Gfo/Idh/MocA family oxidoreductase, partial [Planctomycetota bacterium]
IVHGTVPDVPAFDNNAHVLFHLRSGGNAVISASWTARMSFNSCGVLGEVGTAYTRGSALGNNGIWCSREFHVKTDADEFETVEMIQDDLDHQSYHRETDDFIAAIRTGSTPRATIDDGYETLRISAAVLRSSREGVPIEIE